MNDLPIRLSLTSRILLSGFQPYSRNLVVLSFYQFQILELSYFDDKPERFDSVDALLQSVRELQQYSVIRHQLKSGFVIFCDKSQQQTKRAGVSINLF